MIMDYMAYYIAESGEALQKAEKYRADYIRIMKHIGNWAIDTLGVKAVSVDQEIALLRGVVFEGTQPSNFTKPDKNGLSRPKRTKANAEILKMFSPESYRVMELMPPEFKEFFDWLKALRMLVYGGYLYERSVHWYSDDSPIMLAIPVEPQSTWLPPDYFRKILIEEWRLTVARYKETEKVENKA